MLKSYHKIILLANVNTLMHNVAMDENFARITTHIPKEIYKQMKITAVHQNVSLQKILSQACQDWADKQKNNS